MQKNTKTIKRLIIRIKGMHCIGCENTIREALLQAKGVKNAQVDYITEKATIEFDLNETNIRTIMQVIQNRGYEPEEIA